MSSTSLDQLYRISPKGISLGLERMTLACSRLGNPERTIPFIQVAGTNGKGSVSTMIERGLRACGMKTGLFTSPHIHRFTERFQLDGKEISSSRMEQVLSRVLDLTRGEHGIALTFFEVATLTAFVIFNEEKVDVAVLEVGLGGRLDATTVVQPRVGVITSISFDHQDYLGNTLAAIAREKAGIVKPGMTLICGQMCAEARAAISEVSDAAGVVAHFEYPLLSDSIFNELDTPFFAQRHQRRNAALALAVIENFCESMGRTDARDLFIQSLRSFTFAARFEWIEPKRKFLLDGAHNTEAMQALVNSIAEANVNIRGIIFGALQGKPVDEMLQLLQTVSSEIVLVEAPVARTIDVQMVSQRWGYKTAAMADALALAADRDGVTLVTGSFFVVADARQKLLNEPSHLSVAL